MIRSLSACLALAALIAPPAAAAPRPASVFLEDMTTAEVKARLDTGCPVAILFNGGGEETGPAVALGKHIFRARAYGEAIARNIGDAIVAPVQPFAPNPDIFKPFAGTISLSPATFGAVNEDVARSLITGGFRRIALFGDHGMGLDVLRDLAAKLDAEFKPKGVRIFYVDDGYTRARKQIEAEGVAKGQPAGGHGGLWDAAETLAVKPDAVRVDKFAAGDVSNGGNGKINAEGFAGDPRPSTVAIGKHFAAIRISLATAELQADLKAAGSGRR